MSNFSKAANNETYPTLLCVSESSLVHQYLYTFFPLLRRTFSSANKLKHVANPIIQKFSFLFKSDCIPFGNAPTTDPSSVWVLRQSRPTTRLGQPHLSMSGGNIP